MSYWRQHDEVSRLSLNLIPNLMDNRAYLRLLRGTCYTYYSQILGQMGDRTSSETQRYERSAAGCGLLSPSVGASLKNKVKFLGICDLHMVFVLGKRTAPQHQRPFHPPPYPPKKCCAVGSRSRIVSISSRPSKKPGTRATTGGRIQVIETRDKSTPQVS